MENALNWQKYRCYFNGSFKSIQYKKSWTIINKTKDCGFSINAWKLLCIYLKKPNDNQLKSITITAQKMKFSSVMWQNPQESQVFLKISLRMSIITSLISERSSFLYFYLLTIFTAPKMKFSIKDFFSKCDQIRRKLSGTEEILNGKLYSLSSAEEHKRYWNRTSAWVSSRRFAAYFLFGTPFPKSTYGGLLLNCGSKSNNGSRQQNEHRKEMDEILITKVVDNETKIGRGLNLWLA